MEDMKLIYPALSKHLFYFKMHISKFILDKKYVPLNPFMIFEYFLLDTVDRNIIRNANNNLVKKSDELWVFGSISDGVLAEINLAKQLNKPIRYFTVINSKEIKEVTEEETEFEEDLKNFSN